MTGTYWHTLPHPIYTVCRPLNGASWQVYSVKTLPQINPLPLAYFTSCKSKYYRLKVHWTIEFSFIFTCWSAMNTYACYMNHMVTLVVYFSQYLFEFELHWMFRANRFTKCTDERKKRKLPGKGNDINNRKHQNNTKIFVCHWWLQMSNYIVINVRDIHYFTCEKSAYYDIPATKHASKIGDVFFLPRVAGGSLHAFSQTK